MRHSMAWPYGVSSRAGSTSSRSPRAMRNLPAHEIESGHRFRDRMLDLQPRVHLEKVEAAVFVEQELDRAGVGVADALRDGRGRRRDGARAAPASRPATASLRRPSDDGAESSTRARRTEARCRARRRAPAPRCDAGDEAGARDTRPDRRTPFPLPSARPCTAPMQIRGGLDRPHAFAAAAGDGLDEQRIADALAERRESDPTTRRPQSDRRRPARAARRRVCAAARAAVLLPMSAMASRRRSDERQARVPDGLGERLVLGEETVAGMHGVGARRLRAASIDAIDAQVALARRARSDRRTLRRRSLTCRAVRSHSE